MQLNCSYYIVKGLDFTYISKENLLSLVTKSAVGRQEDEKIKLNH
jgi:hypothetical protein